MKQQCVDKKARTFQVLQKAGHCFAKARCCNANDVICSVVRPQYDVSHDKLVVLAYMLTSTPSKVIPPSPLPHQAATGAPQKQPPFFEGKLVWYSTVIRAH